MYAKNFTTDATMSLKKSLPPGGSILMISQNSIQKVSSFGQTVDA